MLLLYEDLIFLAPRLEPLQSSSSTRSSYDQYLQAQLRYIYIQYGDMYLISEFVIFSF